MKAVTQLTTINVDLVIFMFMAFQNV